MMSPRLLGIIFVILVALIFWGALYLGAHW
jgi:hypothetical protein